jgi:hypothetical protein
MGDGTKECMFASAGLKHWDEGFDRTRFCRSNTHTFKNPTCCNYNQDTTVRNSIATFIPEECLAADAFKEYKEIIKTFACVPCNASPIGEQPWLEKVPKTENGVTVDALKLKICPSLAAAMYLPGKVFTEDATLEAALKEPTKVFDHCGFHVSFDEDKDAEIANGGETKDYFPANWYTNATTFFNSNNFKNKLM